MRVVVTFCNQRSSPKLAVCVVDLDTDERGWVTVPESFGEGAAGLAEIDGDVLVACQLGGVIRYGPDLLPRAVLPTPGATNLHSILVRPDERALYVTSAQNDTLFRYGVNEDGTDITTADEVFCGDPERRGRDRYHLNSVAEWRGELYVTMFGPADGPTHTHRRNGRVVKVSDGSTVAEGLYHPHSLFVHADSLLVIESQARVVRRVAGGPLDSWAIPGGYPRGLFALDDNRVCVGVSSLRRESSSLGTPNVITSSSPVDFLTRIVEIDLRSGQVGQSVDLTLLAGEIFEMRPLPSAAMFRADEDRGLSQRVNALEESFRALRSSRRALEEELSHTAVRRLKRSVRRVRRRFSKA